MLLTDGFKHLQAHVATAAFDSNDNVDAPKCHPNTREAVLDVIMNWITLQTAVRIQLTVGTVAQWRCGCWKVSNSPVHCCTLSIPGQSYCPLWTGLTGHLWRRVLDTVR